MGKKQSKDKGKTRKVNKNSKKERGKLKKIEKKKETNKKTHE